ncbi:MAG: hypothetical protein PUF63_01820 [Prevotella sp.]|nr:hypothetical protein [Prevotella sp.]
MDANEKVINTFATRVRQMILQYEELRKENQRLTSLSEERVARIKELEEKNARIQHDYDTLKMTKMMQVTDGDIEVSRKRVNRLLRDVNKCITLLSEKS